MHSFPLLYDLLIVFSVAGCVVYVFQRFHIPSIVGLLVAGVLVGPYGLGLVSELEQVRLLSEIGVVVLLFAVGLEFSLSRLLSMWKEMLLIGLPQVLGCVIGGAYLVNAHTASLPGAIFGGMLVAMSSTAVVFKLLSDRGELGAPQGKLSVAVLLLQDLLVIVCMLLIPVLSMKAHSASELWIGLGKGFLVLWIVLLASRYLVPPLLLRVVFTRNRELFLLFVFVLCLGTAALTSWAGLSLALGAFLAGLAVSESEYAHQMFSEISPFRDTLSSLFFISVGMLLDLSFAISHLPLVAGAVAAVLLLKFFTSALPTLLLGYPVRIAVLVGCTLAQVGEFSFVLASRGTEAGLLRPDDYQVFLAAAVLTMAITPIAIAVSTPISQYLSGFALTGGMGSPLSEQHEPAALKDHVLIVGYGICGRNLVRALRSADLPYVILEINPEAVRRSQATGEPIFYGDCTRTNVLQHLGIDTARMLVIAISDPAATRRAVQLARQLNPTLHIVARTRYVHEVEDLKRLGANEIIPEEFVTSVEIFARVLRGYQIPRTKILDLIDEIRSDHYEALRGLRPAKLNLLQAELAAQSDLESCTVESDSPALGKSLEELALRNRTGAVMLAVRRNAELLPNPGPDFRLAQGDVAILFGESHQVLSAIHILSPEQTETAPS